MEPIAGTSIFPCCPEACRSVSSSILIPDTTELSGLTGAFNRWRKLTQEGLNLDRSPDLDDNLVRLLEPEKRRLQ